VVNIPQNKNYFWQTLMKKKLPHANVQESVAMAMGALVHTYCQYPDQCLHEVSGGNKRLSFPALLNEKSKFHQQLHHKHELEHLYN
jgi:hypothetical protein